jgi:hypothetical protein
MVRYGSAGSAAGDKRIGMAFGYIEYVGGPPETNRNARRDRKRKTRMVMDNAGVKRIIAALKLKRAKR